MATKPLDSQIDLSNFNPKDDDDQKKTSRGLWVPCRICEGAFGRLRLTDRYCHRCKRAFCDGEHGNFAAQPHGPKGKNLGRCTSCGDVVLGHLDHVQG